MSKRLRDFCVVPCVPILDNKLAGRLPCAVYAVFIACYSMAVRLHDDCWLTADLVPLLARRLNMRSAIAVRALDMASTSDADMFEKIECAGRGFVYRVKHVREFHPRIVWNVRAQNRIDENRTGVPASEKNRKDFSLNGQMHGEARELRESREKEILCSGKRTSGRGQARTTKAAPRVQPRNAAIL